MKLPTPGRPARVRPSQIGRSAASGRGAFGDCRTHSSEASNQGFFAGAGVVAGGAAFGAGVVAGGVAGGGAASGGGVVAGGVVAGVVGFAGAFGSGWAAFEPASDPALNIWMARS